MNNILQMDIGMGSESDSDVGDSLRMTSFERKKTNKKTMNLPWIEKYRPKKVEHILLNDYIFRKLSRMINAKEIQNIILTGKPGIGKTTTVRCLGGKVYGSFVKEYVLELNASDDRGIKIEDNISKFCKSSTSASDKDRDSMPKHKLLIFDEADNMTEKAQHIISKLMRIYNDKARFVFTCNDSQGIIDDIQSKCDIVRYQRVDSTLISLRLEDICDNENVPYTKEGVNYISDICEGDVRSALNILELASLKYGNINVNTVAGVYDKPHRRVLKNMMELCLNGNMYEASKLVFELKGKGYNGSDIIQGMFETIKSQYCDDISKKKRNKLCGDILHTIYTMSKGLDTNIQILNCISNMCHNN